MQTIKAVALVGFYRGVDLIEPGVVLELPVQEFGELRSFLKVDYAPAEEKAAPKRAQK